MSDEFIRLATKLVEQAGDRLSEIKPVDWGYLGNNAPNALDIIEALLERIEDLEAGKDD